jgi:hypothetical protein
MVISAVMVVMVMVVLPFWLGAWRPIVRTDEANHIFFFDLWLGRRRRRHRC